MANNITSEDLKCVESTILDTYRGVFDRASSLVDPLITRSPIGTTSFVHVFTAANTKEREWTGERQVKSAALATLPGQVRKFENTLSVPMDAILSDVLGPYVQEAANLGKSSATFVDRLVAQALLGGDSNPRYINYDGEQTFDTAHANGESNHYASRTLTQANAEAAFADFSSTSDEEGEALYLKPRYMIVPPQLELTARAIATNEFSAPGVSNVLRGMFEVIVIPELASQPTAWYFAAGDNSFTYHVFREPGITSLINPEDHNVFWKDEVIFGWLASAEVLPGPWQLLQKNGA